MNHCPLRNLFAVITNQLFYNKRNGKKTVCNVISVSNGSSLCSFFVLNDNVITFPEIDFPFMLQI